MAGLTKMPRRKKGIVAAHGAQFDDDDDEPVSVERLEAALAFMAYVVITYGKAYAPIMERLERELEIARRRDDPVEKAKRILSQLTKAVDAKVAQPEVRSLPAA